MKKKFSFDFRIAGIAAFTQLLAVIASVSIGVISSFIELPNVPWFSWSLFSLLILTNFLISLGYFIIGKNHHLPRLQKFVIIWFLVGLIIQFLPFLQLLQFFRPTHGPFHAILSPFILIKMGLWIIHGMIVLQIASEIKKLSMYGKLTKSLSSLYRKSGWLWISIIGSPFGALLDLIATRYEISLFFKANKMENKHGTR